MLERFDGKPGASEESIRQLEPHPLPAAYLRFLRRHDGGSGFIGSVYVSLWGTTELIDGNADLDLGSDAPGLFVFGTDGGSEGFAFDTQADGHPVVMIALAQPSRRDAIAVGTSFDDFLDRLARDVSLIPTR